MACKPTCVPNLFGLVIIKVMLEDPPIPLTPERLAKFIISPMTNDLAVAASTSPCMPTPSIALLFHGPSRNQPFRLSVSSHRRVTIPSRRTVVPLATSSRSSPSRQLIQSQLQPIRQVNLPATTRPCPTLTCHLLTPGA